MDLFGVVLEMLFMIPWLIWMGTCLGILFAIGSWHFFPENADRFSVAGYSVLIGFTGGSLLYLDRWKVQVLT